MPQEFVARLLEAFLHLSGQAGRKLGYRDLGDRVGEILGEGPINQSKLTRWFNGETEPDLREVRAIAKACGVDPGWLAFGEASQAPAPGHTKRPGDVPALEVERFLAIAEHSLAELRASAAVKSPVLAALHRLRDVTENPDRYRRGA